MAETYCRNFGMASIGKKKPERKRLGSMVTMTVMNASCCVLATVEANSPMPRLEIRNKPERAKIKPRSPLMGTLNHQCPMTRTSSISMSAKMEYGRIFPTTSSHERIGVTINCSIVPRSRSRTMEEAVNNVVMKYRIIPITPGTLKYAAMRSGLYQTCVRTSRGGVKDDGLPVSEACSVSTLVAYD